MDSLTQIAIGIATVEALAGKQLKNRSFLYGAVLGTLPDLDIWLGKLFPYEMELAFHRSLTHSLLGWILLSPIIAWIIRHWNTELSFKKWSIIVFAAFLTHTAIDLFTAWGVQLLFPLTHRFSFKSIAVVDPVYTLPWIIGLFLVFRTSNADKRLKILRISFILSSLYLLLGLGIKRHVSTQVEKQLTNLQYIDYTVKPTMGNTLLWSVHVKANDHYLIGDFSILHPKKMEWKRYDFDQSVHEQWLRYAPVQTLESVSEGWFIIEEKSPDKAVFNDLRFGVIEREQQFVFAYSLVNEKETTIVNPLPKNLQDGKQAMRSIWNRINGRPAQR